MASAAEIADVTYHYPGGGEGALLDVSATFTAGLTAVAGGSGSGKSTLLRLLNGLVPGFHGGRIRGRVSVGGMDATRVPTAQMARLVGFVFQDPEIQVVRSRVLDEVAFALENTGFPAARMTERVEWALDRVGISSLAGRATGSLSGGERQRVAIASAIALRPAVVVLDEPTSQLDPAGAAAVLAVAAELGRGGTTVVVSEHRCEGLLPLADRLALVSGGRLAAPVAVREAAAHMEDPPGVVALGRALGWGFAPLTVDDARPHLPTLHRRAMARRPPGGEPAWELRGCAAGYGGKTVFSDVDVAGVAGEVSVLMGPNGGGKTSLLRTIAGLLPPLSGTAWRRPGRVAYLPQDPGVLLHRKSVQDEVDYTLKRSASAEPNDYVLTRLGLSSLAGRYPGDLSSGQRQRAALAAILAGRPRLVLLDEPTRGMDAAARSALVSILREMAAGGAAIVVATHDSDLAAALADRVLDVSDGQVSDAGDPGAALSGDIPRATSIGRLFGAAAVSVEEVLACL